MMLRRKHVLIVTTIALVSIGVWMVISEFQKLNASLEDLQDKYNEHAEYVELLEVWREDIESFDLPDLYEPPLGGINTTTRLQPIGFLLLGFKLEIEDLNEKISEFENAPDYDSGWTPLPAGGGHNGTDTVFIHGLGTTEVIVYVIGEDVNQPWGPFGIHQCNYGTDHPDGIYWHSLTESSITIRRMSEDMSWDQVRVMIWKISEPPA